MEVDGTRQMIIQAGLAWIVVEGGVDIKNLVIVGEGK